jgi:hypothetical protein
MKLLVIISVGFDVIDKVLIKFSAFAKILEKKQEYNETVYQLFVDFKKGGNYCIIFS